MILYRLNDQQVRRATTSLMMAPFVVAFLALQIADRARVTFAIGFVVAMTILLSFIVVQIVQSRRFNAVDRESVRG